MPRTNTHKTNLYGHMQTQIYESFVCNCAMLTLSFQRVFQWADENMKMHLFPFCACAILCMQTALAFILLSLLRHCVLCACVQSICPIRTLNTLTEICKPIFTFDIHCVLCAIHIALRFCSVFFSRWIFLHFAF